MEREEFDRINVFGLGNENIDYAQYFIGKSYLNYLTKIDDANYKLSRCSQDFGVVNQIRNIVNMFI